MVTKKTASWLCLLLVITFAFVGCGGNSSTSTSTSDSLNAQDTAITDSADTRPVKIPPQ